MVTFDRKNLIESQKNKLDRIYKDINFFVWLGWIITTIISIVVMYFFSIVAGLWFESVVVFCCAMYYMIMSFVKERMALGYYQKAKSITVSSIKKGLVFKQVIKDDEKDFLIAYCDINRVFEYNTFIVIMLKSEGKITLPNVPEAEEIKQLLKDKLQSAYLILN